jgi:hypothetical protein
MSGKVWRLPNQIWNLHILSVFISCNYLGIYSLRARMKVVQFYSFNKYRTVAIHAFQRWWFLSPPSRGTGSTISRLLCPTCWFHHFFILINSWPSRHSFRGQDVDSVLLSIAQWCLHLLRIPSMSRSHIVCENPAGFSVVQQPKKLPVPDYFQTDNWKL